MIGVLADSSQFDSVQEFFELFKTPWERLRDDRRYDVVVSADGSLPAVPPRLLILYGSKSYTHEQDPGDCLTTPMVTYAGASLPLYGSARTFQDAPTATPVAVAGARSVAIRRSMVDGTVVRVGYDLFDEVNHLLTNGQPAQNAGHPALEIHISLLRQEIVLAGIPLLEIPAVPAGSAFHACLTHDIDFVGIRHHFLDHTMWGFAYRATVGAVAGWLRGTTSFRRLLGSWCAVLKLPLVYLRLAKDFWLPFEWYLEVEKELHATYFLIPYRDRPGEKVSASHPSRRASKYDVADIPEWIALILSAGNEIGVHGIDAWHSVDAARDELERVSAVTGRPSRGIRMHWLLQDRESWRVLDESGVEYDSTAGYNGAIGYRCGTTQVFRPPGASRLLELPLHIQDGALFFPDKLALSELQASDACNHLIRQLEQHGGVLTVLWHDRSHAPERYWGDFYIRLLKRLRDSGATFGSAEEVVDWFRQRRSVRFHEARNDDGTYRTIIRSTATQFRPAVRVRVHNGMTRMTEGVDSVGFSDLSWTGAASLSFEQASGDLHDAAR